MQILILLAYILLLSAFLGFELISKVPSALHTPLMSGANAISGITLLCAMIAAGMNGSWHMRLLAFFAVIFATVNIVGGYLVTHRMLKMFTKKEEV